MASVSGERLAILAVLGTGLVDPATPIARADDAGLTRGDGCFEGCRLRDGVVDKLDAHLARMARSAASLAIPFDESAWRALVATASAAWPVPGEASMKLLLSRGSVAIGEPTGFVWITELAADYVRLRRDGIKVITLERGLTSDVFAGAPWLLGGVKTLSYAINMAAQRVAAARGADDVLFVAADGLVLEAPTGSVVWAVGRTLHTTPIASTGILPGTTQHLLFERAPSARWRTADTLATVDDLHAADVVWITSSVRGPVELVELDGKARVRRPEVDAEIRRLSGF